MSHEIVGRFSIVTAKWEYGIWISNSHFYILYTFEA